MGHIKYFPVLVLGAVLSAAQLTLLWSFLPNGLVSDQMAAGWIFIIVPVGASFGLLVSTALCRFPIVKSWETFLTAWIVGVFFGFPAALSAPASFGLGPKSPQFAITIFVVQCVVTWGILIWLIRMLKKEN